MSKSQTDYRALKKMLNKYHSFSFDMPKKGKQFTPNQKRAITLKYKKLQTLIIAKENAQAVFIPNKKVDGMVSTNKGTFVAAANAHIVKPPKKYSKLTLVKIEFGKRKELFIPFPKSIKDSIDKIKEFVEEMRKIHKPDYIRWATKGQVRSEVYNPDSYTLYGAQYFSTETNHHKDVVYLGVYFGWRPSGDDFIVSRPDRPTSYKKKKS